MGFASSSLTVAHLMGRERMRKTGQWVIGSLLWMGLLGVVSVAHAVDFATRCADPNVIRCYDFENAADMGPRIFARSSGGTFMTRDTSQKASGASSLRAEVPPLSPADTSGSFFINFADDFSQRFGAGTEFYVQWRQRFSPEMLRSFRGGNGWKQIIVGAGDYPGTVNYSCSEQETVFQQDGRSGGGGHPWVYHSCGRFDDLEYSDGTQIRMQHTTSPPCYYPNDPQGGCKKYVANQWMTFQMHIKIVQWNNNSSRFRAWAAAEGEPSVMIYDSDLSGGMTYYRNNDPNAFFGKVWLLPYNTGKDASENHATAYTWYDDLIISRTRIADPDGSLIPTPQVTLQANPATVNAQGSSTLTWSSTDANACTASGGSWTGTKATSGTESVGPIAATTTYTLSCTNTQGGSNSKSVTVTVASSTPAPTVDLSANPTSVVSGGSTNLSWTSANATACTASGNWSGAKATSGSQSVGPLTANRTYTLTCTGTGGSGNDTQAVTVTSADPAPTLTLNANPTSIASGGTSTLTWNTQNATGCTASGGWTGAKMPTGTQQVGPLTATTSYSLTCTGGGGSITRQASVTVGASPPPAAAPVVTLGASPMNVESGGTSTLTWSATNSTSCTASDGWTGAKSGSGSQAVGPLTGRTTFTLACTGAGGTDQKSVTIEVAASGNAPPEDSGGGGALNALFVAFLALMAAAHRAGRTTMVRRQRGAAL
jgi:hypothetical protein